jgi:hypothetical protein
VGHSRNESGCRPWGIGERSKSIGGRRFESGFSSVANASCREGFASQNRLRRT